MYTMLAVLLLVTLAIQSYAKDDIEKLSCKDEKGTIFPNGYSEQVEGRCEQKICQNSNWQSKGCGQVIGTDNKPLPEIPGVPYPECCPKLSSGN